MAEWKSLVKFNRIDKCEAISWKSWPDRGQEMGDGTVTSLRWRSDKRPATGGMVASNKMASVQKLQMFYHFKLFLFVAVFLLAERINCRQFNIILHHLGQIFFSEMCFPCTSHSMREEATTSIFSATYGLNSSQKVEIRENLCPGYWRWWFPQLPVSAYAPMQHPAPQQQWLTAAITPDLGFSVRLLLGLGQLPSLAGFREPPAPSPAQPSCPLLPVEEGDIDMIAIYRWTWSCLISTVDI